MSFRNRTFINHSFVSNVKTVFKPNDAVVEASVNNRQVVQALPNSAGHFSVNVLRSFDTAAGCCHRRIVSALGSKLIRDVISATGC